MAAPSPSTNPPTDASSPSPTSTSPAPGSGDIIPSNGNPTSLYLYTFVATLALLFVIFGALIARSVHMRRRRNAAILAAIAAGTYVPQPRTSKRRDDPLAPKPVLWEVHTGPASPADDPEKGWAGILPVAGATLVPVSVTQQAPPAPLQHSVGSLDRRASWSPRWLSRVPSFFGRGRRPTGPPAAPDLPTIASSGPLASSSEPPPPPLPSEPVRLAVLISMPTRTARGRPEHEKGEPPVVEFGVAQVTYARPT